VLAELRKDIAELKTRESILRSQLQEVQRKLKHGHSAAAATELLIRLEDQETSRFRVVSGLDDGQRSAAPIHSARKVLRGIAAIIHEILEGADGPVRLKDIIEGVESRRGKKTTAGTVGSIIRTHSYAFRSPRYGYWELVR
jgi:hypothetical protein